MHEINKIFIQLPLYSLLPIIFSIITFIIGCLYIYLYFKKVNTSFIYLGLWVINLSLVIFLIGISHLMNNYISAVWLAKIYYIPFVLSLLFYYLLIYHVLRLRPDPFFYLILTVCVSYLFLVFTRYFIPFEPCSQDLTSRFIFKKGFLYYIYMGFIYFVYIYSTLLLGKHPMPQDQKKFFNPRLYFFSMIVFMVLGINDFAGILHLYHTIPTLSYGFIIFILIGIFPYFKNYILYYNDLNQNYYKTVNIFAKVLENYDRDNYRYYRQTGEYASLIGQFMNFSPQRQENLRLIPILHNIGKIGLPQKYLTGRSIPRRFKKKIEEGQRIIFNMMIFNNMKDIINFPDFTRMRKGEYTVDVQILSLSDHINEESTKQYLKNELQLDRLINEALDEHGIDPVLRGTILANKLKFKNAVLENLLGMKGHV